MFAPNRPADIDPVPTVKPYAPTESPFVARLVPKVPPPSAAFSENAVVKFSVSADVKSPLVYMASKTYGDAMSIAFSPAYFATEAAAPMANDIVAEFVDPPGVLLQQFWIPSYPLRQLSDTPEKMPFSLEAYVWPSPAISSPNAPRIKESLLFGGFVNDDVSNRPLLQFVCCAVCCACVWHL
ncbi:protein of unknown function (plasmid) [Paraburkholderia dioscoreae]|uniref:Uncharacterized protein n=1 Tax=Paraburkholderia dioscoreae TaxID=2604047 RepID=A0A5Q4YWP9_9BURK|nr:protein of unknown function [Paraburkholderia dioscoreae]